MQDALDELPPEYAEQIANVEFIVKRAPTRQERQRLRLRGHLYGLYEGVPLTRRDSSYDKVMPDRITLYWGTLVRDFPRQEELAEQVRKTVYHEIGHYFGLEEADLRHTSVE
jgi:predicted Zn-dependent protease with MMP-like domain